MQVTETLSQGLKREYDISLPASDLAEKLNGQLADLKAKVRINGFRPGKVPVEHLRKVYGKSVMAEVVQEAIASANKKIVDDNGLRLAREPKIELPTDQAAIEAALEARGDLNFKVALEVLPVFEIGDFSQTRARAPVAEVEDADVDRRPRTAWPRSVGPIATSRKAAGPKIRTASRSISSARSTACRSKAARAGTSRWCSARTPSSRASRSSLLGAAAGRGAHDPGDLPGGLRGARARRQDGGLRRDGQGGRRRPSRSRSTTNSPKASVSKASTS